MLTTHGLRALAIPLCALLLLGLVFRRAGALSFLGVLFVFPRAAGAEARSRSDRRIFREVLAHLSRAGTLESWWEGICRAAERLGFRGLCVTIEVRGEEKRVLAWQGPSCSPGEAVSVDLDLSSHDPRVSLRLVCMAAADAPAELAGQRAALLGRLIDAGAPLEPSARRKAA